MKPIPFISSLALLLASHTFAQNTTAPYQNLHFALLECDNHLTQYGYKDPSHPTNIAWNLIGMFPTGDPRSVPATQRPGPYYSLPQNGVPYQKYEGFNSTVFFWNDLRENPSGWLHLGIPESARGKKTDVQAGTAVFEGVEFNCARDYGALFRAGGEKCLESNPNFCAPATYCQIRYVCRREKWPVDRDCVLPSSKPFCYPHWDRSG